MKTRTPQLKARLFDVKAGAPAYEIKAAGDDVAEVLLYDEIGGWGIYSDDFARDLAKVTAKTIRLRIHSPGGSVFEGVNMFNALRRHGARIEVHVDALAASIASIIAMAGDEIHMAENAYLMIHNPWSIAVGDSAEMLKNAEILEKLQGTMADIYSKRAGKSPAEAQEWMTAETWFTAAEAKEAGLIDAVEDTVPGPAARFDLSHFAKAPAKAATAGEAGGGGGFAVPPSEIVKRQMALAQKERE